MGAKGRQLESRKGSRKKEKGRRIAVRPVTLSTFSEA